MLVCGVLLATLKIPAAKSQKGFPPLQEFLPYAKKNRVWLKKNQGLGKKKSEELYEATTTHRVLYSFFLFVVNVSRRTNNLAYLHVTIYKSVPTTLRLRFLASEHGNGEGQPYLFSPILPQKRQQTSSISNKCR